MGNYYIHKVGHQEMGSVSNRDDIPSRGRYFLISKKYLDFFPHLSSVVMNDKIIITIVPLIEGVEDKKVICTMDYHNQRYADITYQGANPRDEIRLYLNNSIDPRKKYFYKDDFAIFEKITEDNQSYYSLSRITPEDESYEYINNLLSNEAPGNKHNLQIEKVFDFIRKPNFAINDEIIISDTANKLIIDEGNQIIIDENEEDNNEEEAMGSSFFNSSLFRDLVMNAYNYKCAITGKVIRYKDLFNLEAAHIKPQAHNGTFLPCNGIAMSRDMHFAFDKGFFTIDDDYKIVVSNELIDNWFFKEYNGKSLNIPIEQFYQPNKKYLEHHRNKVFNTFKQIRRI